MVINFVIIPVRVVHQMGQYMRQLLYHRLKQDTIPLLLFFVTFVIMSYPFIFQMNDHLPMDNVDTHHALWQNWWVLESFSNGYDVNFTPLLFHPAGLDVTLLPPRWSSLVFWLPIYSIFGDPFAFNMTAMIGILIKAYGMYLLGLYLFKHRIPAWVCGAFYAFAATSLQMHLQQPLTGATEWLPWFMLAYVYSLDHIKSNKQPLHIIGMMILAGLFFSFCAYANLKIAIFATLLGGGFVILYMLAHSLWRIPLFWIAMIAFGISAIGFSLPVLLPVLQSSDLATANDGVILMGGIDILSFFKATHNRPFNYMQPIAAFRGEQLEIQNIWGMSHVGFVSIAFVLMGLLHSIRVKRIDIKSKQQYKPIRIRFPYRINFKSIILIWGILAFVFWSLSLGLEARYYRELVTTHTPYRLLENNFIFQTIKWPWRLSLVFLFPFSILIGYGLNYRLKSITLNRKQWAWLILSVVMLLYGTSIFPIPMRPAPRPAYLQELAQLPDSAIINLPLGRHNAKYYMSIQRFHQRPMIEGMIARPPDGTYDYINSNAVLSIMNHESDLTIDDLSIDDWSTAWTQLQDDGFQYVVFHKIVPQTATRQEIADQWMIDLFKQMPTVYEDELVWIFDLDTIKRYPIH